MLSANKRRASSASSQVLVATTVVVLVVVTVVVVVVVALVVLVVRVCVSVGAVVFRVSPMAGGEGTGSQLGPRKSSSQKFS